ncbi:MAG: GEVED domain-containing protein, partial [Candidatus Nanoarchaeia archaeon]|nr:GEVED domain-containing protein [Candidatus Nanoarchaeia archaeon]
GISRVYPLTDIKVNQNKFFNVTFNVSCLSGNCGTINVSLDPVCSSANKNNYCSNNGGIVSMEWIQRMQFNGIDLNSGPNGYLDATSNISNTLILGDSYLINITFGMTSGYDEYLTVWFDWDQNNTFDSSEKTNVGHCAGNGCSVSAYISVPLNAKPGSTMFRVYGNYASYPSNPCTAPTYNDVEDYTACVEGSSQNKGLISSFIGATPFYTTTNNPFVTNSLNSGQSQIVTFWVNATGSADNYTFFGYANMTSNLAISNITSNWNVEIVSIDTTPPYYTNLTTNPTLPLTTNASAKNISINFTSSEYPINLTFNLYNSIGTLVSTQGPYVINSQADLPKIFTIPGGLADGNYTLNMTLVDLAGNRNETTLGKIIILTSTSASIGISRVYPLTDIKVNQNKFFNVTFNVSCLSGNCGTINVSLDPNLQQIYYVNTADCTPWSNSGCSTADERGYSGSSTMTCNYLDTLPSGSIVSKIQVDAYVKYICSPANLTFRWAGSALGTYSTIDCSCSAGHPVSYNLSSPSYNLDGTNYIYVDNGGGNWGGIMGGTAVGWTAGKILKVTVDYQSESSSKGLISNTIGATPFYTTTNNPFVTNSLNSGQSQIVTFLVNATGNLDNYTFFGYANMTSNLAISNITSNWNVEIVSVDTIPPYYTNLVTNPTLPLTTNASAKNISVNFTSSEYPVNLTFNLYNATGYLVSTQGPYVINSQADLPKIFTIPGGLADGNYTLNMTLVDLAGNRNETTLGKIIIVSSSVNPAVGISRVYPLTDIKVNQNKFFNVTFNVSCLSGNCGTINVSLDPVCSGEIINQLTGIENCSDEYASSYPCSATSNGVTTDYWFGTTSSVPYPTPTKWVYGDLVIKKCISSVRVFIYSSDVPQKMNIDVSDDAITWTRVYTNWTVSLGDQWVNLDFPETAGRFVRYTLVSCTRPYCNFRDFEIGTRTFVSMGGEEKGLISNTIGATPFYTTTNNPFVTNSLNSGQSQIVTFLVNATGNLDNYTFFGYANMTSNLAISNITSNWNVEIVSGGVSLGPKIYYVQPISPVNVEPEGLRIININFSVYDENGYTDINSSSARLNVTRGNIARQGLSCFMIPGSGNGNYANYSCNVSIRFFDNPGDWNIRIFIKDNSGNLAVNDSTTFYYIPLQAWDVRPNSVNWSNVLLGFLNQKSDNNLTIINQGNVNITNAIVNASNLQGQTFPSDIIPAGNFRAGKESCNGADLILDGKVSMAFDVNYTESTEINPVSKDLGFCLKSLTDVRVQTYLSTRNWGIDVVFALVAVTFRGRKRKRKANPFEKRLYPKTDSTENELLKLVDKKIKERFGISVTELISEEKEIKITKNIEVPISIFKEDSGPAEMLCTYLHENLNLKFSEISRLINRNPRTVWMNYHNSNKKKIIPDETSLKIPVNLFSDRRLSILESLVKYMKEKGFRNKEIAIFLNQDQRVISTLYSRVNKKIK